MFTFRAVKSKLMCMEWDRSLLVNSEKFFLILANVGVQECIRFPEIWTIFM